MRPIWRNEISLLLGFNAARALQHATTINPHVPLGLDPQRTRAIDNVIEAVKKANPQLFRR